MSCPVIDPYESLHSSLYPLAVRRLWTNLHLYKVGWEYVGLYGAPRRALFAVVEEERAPPLFLLDVSMWRGAMFGYVEGYLADLPAPPLPGFAEDGGTVWTRLVVTGVVRTWDFNEVGLLPTDPPAFNIGLNGFVTMHPYYIVEAPIAARLSRTPIPESRHLQDVRLKAEQESFPGTGKLTGEEFRIVEPDNDYLRLVGRGGDEYLAWDLVLGTLDSGEWVLFAEDGLYLAKREGGRVVVVGPYGGSVFDVRGPPYAPFYPVVPVKWIRERVVRALELARREVVQVDGEPYFYLPPLDPAYLLKWPLVLFKWEYRIVSHFAPFGGEVLLEDCEKVCQRVDPRPEWCGQG